MTWWLVSGVIVLAVVVLVATVLTVMGRLRPLGLALRRLTLRAEQAERLQGKLVAVQERADHLRGLAEEAATRAERLRR